MTKITSAQLVSDARAAIEHISAQDALLFINGNSHLFVDIRDKEDIERGHITGAIHASRGMLEFYLDPESEFHIPELSSDKTLIFVCGSGGRAALATKLAKDFGFEAICLTGGMREWNAKNAPLAD